jgi:hypothetical protein
MPRIRSLLTTVQITSAERAHNCQGNANHRIIRGERRLTVTKDRASEHYCLNCGRQILERDATKIAGFLSAIDIGDNLTEQSK